MRNTAPMGSKESRILWSLIPSHYKLACSAALLALVVAAAPVAADDLVADDQPFDPPAGGVTIRLELQPSAPDAIAEAPAAKETLDKIAGDEDSAAEDAGDSATEDSVVKIASKAVDKPLEDANVANKSSAKSVADKPLTLDRLPSDPSPVPATLSNSRTSRELNSRKAEVAETIRDRDFSNERSESEQNSPLQLELKPDDVPLEQEEHPYDAPAAKSDSSAIELYRPAPAINRAELEANPFTQRELNIKVGIQTTLNYYLTHPENTTRRGPWALMHALLPLGVESEVLAGSRRVNTIGWLCFNGTCGKQNMFQPTRTGFRPNVGPGVQGHEGQFLAMLAQSRVPANYPLQINRRKYTVMDLAHYEMATCRERSELTFKLIGLSYYLEPNQQWRDNRGQIWSLEKMVAEEIAQPINGAACGGVHRLMGLSYSLIERQSAGEPITGQWERSKIYINDYVNYTMSLQNPDGSFSTNWLESRGMDPNVERKVQTTGHILEWLVYTLPDDHLRSPRVLSAMEFLLNTVGREPQRDWPIGPRGHALRAMSLYSQRVFGAEVGQLKSYVAEVSTAPAVR